MPKHCPAIVCSAAYKVVCAEALRTAAGDTVDSILSIMKTSTAQVILPDDSRIHGPPSLFYGGLMRMGSLSLAHALSILGTQAHHALEASWDDWKTLKHAADATWPGPNNKAISLKQADWNQLFGDYICITDIASLFAPQILEAYPNIKVIVVQRDFDDWWPSFKKNVILPTLDHGSMLQHYAKAIETMASVAPCSTMQQILLSYYSAKTIGEVEANARQKYEEHYAHVRKVVPAERLLEYRLGSGWEPLCRFLDMKVPNIPFPRVNDTADFKTRISGRKTELMMLAWKRAQIAASRKFAEKIDIVQQALERSRSSHGGRETVTANRSRLLKPSA
ncbi:hypothetical protein LTS08_003259 [Lithohypha guttulata]|nr:hypothetical protein LTS08_003259 [Lithohypha guttulata]